MAMRARQPLPFYTHFPIVYNELRKTELETYEFVSVNQSENILPSVETTNLKDMLVAGVNLQQVNSKILGSSSIDVPADLLDSTFLSSSDKLPVQEKLNNSQDK